jgi:integrase
LTPSQTRRKPKSHARRAKRDRYDRDSYRRAITYAIQRVNRDRQQAGLPEIAKWCPLQLRHIRATEIRGAYGLEASQIWLGHKHADITQLYAEADFELGLQIAREVG